MKVLVIAGHLTEGVLGQFEAGVQFEKHSLCVDGGKSLFK